MKLKDKLIEMNACSDAVEWVGRRSLKTAWAECERGDWMLWLAGRAGIDRKTLVLAACDCAEMALKYVPEGENRPANAIKITRAWAEGNATIEEVREARKDAAYAVCAAYAAYAAACAAYAAYADAAYAAYAAARTKARKTQAEIIRNRITYVVIAEATK